MTENTSITDPRRNRSWMFAAVLFTATGVAGVASQGPDGDEPFTGGRSGTSADGTVSLEATPDRSAVLQGGDGLVRLELAIRGAAGTEGTDALLPTDLVVVLDRSGSMQGEKIRSARAAIHQLLSQLGAEDRFGLVAFSSDAHVAVPLSHPTPEASAVLSATVDGLRAGGGTFMSTGLDLGLDLIESARAAGRVARLVLISDGLAAEGHDVLRAQARRAAAGEFALSAVGVGADFDESLMSALADEGTGNYYYLDEIRELADVFRNEFQTARETVATGLAVTVAPGDGVEVVDAAGYPLERSAEGAVFRPGSLFAGQERRVWVTLRVPTGAAGDFALGRIALSYTDPRGARADVALEPLPRVACVEQEDRFLSSLDEDQWARSVAVEEWGQLRHQVADLVARGDGVAARREIDAFQTRNAALNARVAAPSVARKIEEAEQLEDEVSEAFSGADQQARQNQLGKSLGYQALLERRAGSRK